MAKQSSYYGFVRSGTGTLLGGVKAHESSRFETQAQAQAWLDCVVAGNKAAGRDVAFALVYASPRKPEIKKDPEPSWPKFGCDWR